MDEYFTSKYKPAKKRKKKAVKPEKEPKKKGWNASLSWQKLF